VNSPIIDVHAHVFPRQAIKVSGTGTPWHGSLVEQDDSGAPITLTGSKRQVYGSALHYQPPEARIEQMDALGVDIQVLSVLPPLYRYELPTDVAVPAARDINDDIADLCQRWPSRFLGLATLPLQDTGAALAEIDRALDDLGLVGVEIGTYVGDRNLDDPELFPVFEALAARRAFVFCHPSHPRGGSTMKRYFLSNLIGNPWETAIAMASLMFGGPLDRLADLTVCFAHGGGFGAFDIGRLRHGWEVRQEPREHGTASPNELIKRVYVDSLVHNPRAVKYLLDTVGPSNVLLGSDFPADMGPADPVGELVRSELLTDDEKQAVLRGNAERLLTSLGRQVPAPTSP
jgi:aminocarboxymuconate-semialdehyde decarboxylase